MFVPEEGGFGELVSIACLYVVLFFFYFFFFLPVESGLGQRVHIMFVRGGLSELVYP